MTDKENTLLEMVKDAFNLQEVRQETYIQGFFSGKASKYFIPEKNLSAVVKEFPFMKNAVKAGLISKDKRTGEYYTTDRILMAKATDKRGKEKRQFFSINGDDDHERTTLKDALATLLNLRYISKKFGVSGESIKFTLRHENGNSDKVLNYVELDKRLFGNTEEEIVNNVSKMNSLVQYERVNINEEKASV